ncbi:TlpA family protein disulfide reductase [Myxococcota bacterium]|nr:TlpA family protein disulfide reductase [Myxococcota bacterium]
MGDIHSARNGLLLPLLAPAVLWALAGCAQAQGDDDDTAGGDEIGYDVGEIVPDFSLPDQDGADTTLSSFAGQRVLLDFSALWCTPCAEAADHAEAVQGDLSAEFAFQYVMVLAEGEVPGNAATVEDAVTWADDHGLSIPVLADVDGVVAPGFLAAAGQGALPQFYVLDEDLRVCAVHVGYGTGDEEAVAQAVRACGE